ncbi:inner membrane protein COX18 [Thecamonas trahens ATCC 50062]|uniref:Inner membrane protein COX18 n=1 Tax=Thecamonas trahens ATCC 50062 TaxID=461836 RepID=A0A0L0D9L9_THETB|nr:inner membrane protein COX18 [Thecamonas trahens ATCC 50062]KNC47988.1 inner membrane protein COX18 [Thecamonas trahens ATCC 50062]|eukprot:XP_013759005.1 inner membrane protein COX18 [Thecamonas trahens ATCC 50062]
MPWWAVLAAATLASRAALSAPLSTAMHLLTARAVNAAAEAKAGAQATLIATAAACKRRGLPFEEFKAELARASAAAAKVAAAKHGAAPSLPLPGGRAVPLHVFLPWLQIPVWITASLTIRSMAAFPALGLATPDAPVAGFASGGTAWFGDLAAPDPLLLLPTAIVILNLANLEFMALSAPAEAKGAAKILTNVLRGLSIFSFPLLVSMPAGLTWYWALSSGYGLAQSVTLRIPRVRRALGIPHTPMEDAPTVWSQRLAALRASKASKSEP